MADVRHLLAINQLTNDTILGLLALARRIKSDAGEYRPLAGKTLALLFAKASTRTRVSFEVGMFQLGGHALVLPVKDSQLGRGEPISDTAKVLSRYVDGIMLRTYQHESLVKLATHASVPVINGLTDTFHPCQVLADLLTIVDAFGAAKLRTLTVAWVGDGNNMAHSWIGAAQVLGFELRLACPKGYEPDADILAKAQAHNQNIKLYDSVMPAVEGCHVVTTDVWASMGQEVEASIRQTDFAPFQVNGAVMRAADPSAIFLHCLPAHRGEEVTAEVIDGPQSMVFDEAENRLHIQKAILCWSIGRQTLPSSFDDGRD
ncbi:MAG: ornithine carbamoyltransferase [Myxococcota bacterium]|nr:ornithine carbamoyltransferase [Myxococcota bacterium]